MADLPAATSTQKQSNISPVASPWERGLGRRPRSFLPLASEAPLAQSSRHSRLPGQPARDGACPRGLDARSLDGGAAYPAPGSSAASASSSS